MYFKHPNERARYIKSQIPNADVDHLLKKYNKFPKIYRDDLVEFAVIVNGKVVGNVKTRQEAHTLAEKQEGYVVVVDVPISEKNHPQYDRYYQEIIKTPLVPPVVKEQQTTLPVIEEQTTIPVVEETVIEAEGTVIEEQTTTPVVEETVIEEQTTTPVVEEQQTTTPVVEETVIEEQTTTPAVEEQQTTTPAVEGTVIEEQTTTPAIEEQTTTPVVEETVIEEQTTTPIVNQDVSQNEE